MYCGYKKTPATQGLAILLFPLISRNVPPELAPFPRFCTGGLPGFIGPFPSTSLDEAVINVLHMFSCPGTTLFHLLLSIQKKERYVKCDVRRRRYNRDCNAFFSHHITFDIELRAGLPRVQVFVLLRCERINANAHRVQFETRNLFVEFGGQRVDTRLQTLRIGQHIF